MPIYPTGVEKLLMFTKMFHFQISVNIAFKVLNYICESENLNILEVIYKILGMVWVLLLIFITLGNSKL